MKKLLYIFIILISNSIVAQITFEPVFMSQCSREVGELDWFVTDTNGVFVMNEYGSKSVSLPKIGKYTLHLNFDDGPFTISISKEGLTRDTFLLKRIQFVTYVSNPPRSEYLDCDSLANGEIIDYYTNGNKRMQGVFINGQPIDSVFSYYESGKLSEIFIPNQKKWKQITYFENGQIQSIEDNNDRYEKEYYTNGQLKKERYWSDKFHHEMTEYYANGGVKMLSDYKMFRRFNEKGILIEKIKRRDISFFNRLFAKNIYDHFNKEFRYKWQTFDANGIIQRKIIFENNGISMDHSFPNKVEQINYCFFNKIIFFENGIKAIKLDFKYVKENDESIRKFFIYKKRKNRWIREKVVLAGVYEIIATFSK